MNQYDVFISLASEDKDTVKKIIEELRTKYNLSCWVYYEHIKGGQNYQNLIPSAIDNSAVTVLFISEYSVSSTEVPKELAIAEAASKPIIPYWISKTEYKASFRYNLTALDYIDASSDPIGFENIKKLAEAIGSYIDKNVSSKKELDKDFYIDSIPTHPNEIFFKSSKTSQKDLPLQKISESPKGNKKTSAKTSSKFSIIAAVVAILFLISVAITALASIDSTPPKITLSEPLYYNETIEFTVFIEEDSEILSVNIDKDDVITKGFTGNLEVVDNGTTQTLKFTDLDIVNSEECQITLFDGIAIDTANNKSEGCSSVIFLLDLTRPTMAIGPKDTNKVIKEGDTAVYTVVFNDNIGVTAVSLNKENIIMHGFDADISIKKINTTVREITFSNIKFNDSDEKYFEITEGVSADSYGNLNKIRSMPLKTK